MSPISFSRQMQPRGLAGDARATANVEEQDVPPGAPPYASGPLANPSQPSPTPRASLTTLAAGGTNHQEAWMNGNQSPESFPKQAPFSASESDLPPGTEGTYYGGPLANPPKPSPTPNLDLLKKFSWSSQFDQPSGYY